jgi:Flp pilus assembly protein TadG
MKKDLIQLKNILKNSFGFATLPTILAVSGMIIVVAAGIAASTYTETQSTAVDLQSAAALRAAESGANDALMRIARNKNYSCVTIDCYSFDIQTNGCAAGTGCAKVTVSAGAGTAGDPKIITAKGLVQNDTRKLQVNVVYDASGYGQINSATWQEITN